MNDYPDWTEEIEYVEQISEMLYDLEEALEQAKAMTSTPADLYVDNPDPEGEEYIFSPENADSFMDNFDSYELMNWLVTVEAKAREAQHKLEEMRGKSQFDI